MRHWALFASAVACESPAVTLMPALHGVEVVTASDRGSPEVVDRIGEWTRSVSACVADAYGGIELSADVAPAGGDETILTSFSQGVVVVGADGRRIASIEGFDCAGSQDDLVAVAIVRTSLDAPVIAVVATEGGRRQSTTWLELLAVGSSDRLDRLFVGEIERHDDDGVRTGDVTMIPGGLLYRAPTGGVALWRYDAATHRFVTTPQPEASGPGDLALARQ